MEKSLVYKSDYFVEHERIDEIEAAKKAIRAGVKRRPIEERVVAFTGDRGVGLSWLLFHIHRSDLISDVIAECLPNDGASIEHFLITFDNFALPEDDAKTDSGQNAFPEFVIPRYGPTSSFTVAILQKICERIGAIRAKDATAHELSQWMERKVRQRVASENGFTLVLLMDAIFEADQRDIAQIETYLLKPLLPFDNVVFIMSGRGAIPAWEAYELRYMEKGLHLVEPFPTDSGGTTRQLEKILAGESAEIDDIRKRMLFDTIPRLSGGYPLSNFHLCTQLTQVDLTSQELRSEMFSETHVVEALNKTAHALLGEYGSQLKGFEALCLLDGFREWEVDRFFSKYFHEPRYQQDNTFAMQTFLDMLKTRLITWDHVTSRYRMNESLRVILDRFLWFRSKLGDQDPTWTAMHQYAESFYQEFAKNSALTALYLERANYHRKQLESDPLGQR